MTVELGQPRPMRPVPVADEGKNSQLSKILSEILVAIAGIMDDKIRTVQCAGQHRK